MQRTIISILLLPALLVYSFTLAQILDPNPTQPQPRPAKTVETYLKSAKTFNTIGYGMLAAATVGLVGGTISTRSRPLPSNPNPIIDFELRGIGWLALTGFGNAGAITCFIIAGVKKKRARQLQVKPVVKPMPEGSYYQMKITIPIGR